MKPLKDAIKKKLGDDYRTTVIGHLLLLCAGISMYPDLIDFIPNEDVKSYIKGVCGILTFIFGSAVVTQVRDKKAHIEYIKSLEQKNEK